MKKLLSILLAMLMAFSIVPLSVSAVTYTGECGDSLTFVAESLTSYPYYWKITVSGNGDMDNYAYEDKSVFSGYQVRTEHLIIEEGVTSIGDYAFSGFEALETISIAKTVTVIGKRAFYAIGQASYGWTTLEYLNIPFSVTEICTSAFEGRDIDSLVISRNLKKIESSNFRGGIDMVHFLGNEDDWNNITIENNNNGLINATRHYCNPLDVTEATCSTAGTINTWYCSDCDKVFEGGESIEVVEHNYTSEITIEPTHLTEGVKTFTCACGDTYTEPVAKLEDHTYTSEVTTEPTHLTEGVKTFTCACGDTYTEPVAKLEDHTYTSEVTTEPTHLTEGVKTFTCACGDTYTEPVAKLEDHTYTSEVTKEATHLEEGETTYTCACGDSYTEAIAKLEGHTYEEVVTEPTCTAKGYTTYTCACGDTYISDYIGMISHNYSSSITTPATHLTEGIKTYTCSSCGNGYTEKIAKTPQHTYTTSKVTKPTCTDKGYTSHYCECGDSYNDNYTSATGHKYNGQTCVNCGKKCSCTCHKSGFMGFIWKIILFFNKLFKTNKTCACGVSHY